MCEACESDEPYEPREAVPPGILSAARAIEAALAGDPVPEKAWTIYFGEAGGAITWPQYQRIRASFEAALASAPPVPLKPSFDKRRSPIRCERVA
jgi:hypothetical protein